MDGFVLTIGNRCPDRAFDNYSPPGYPDKSLLRVAMGEGASFAYWGDTLGDACYASGADNSLLILSGYITDGVVVDNFGSQQKVAESLLEHIDQQPSLERIRKLPDKLYGAFSIIYVDGEGQSAYIITDRVAARPVWVKSLKNLHIISSHTMAAAWFSDDLEYDLGGLASLLLYRCQVEPTKCLYRGINAVPEGTVATISTPGGMENHRWYRFKHSPDEKTSYKGWLDLASQSLRRGAERILKTSENPLVFLSGGIDSRLTASALRAAGGKPLLATLGDAENNEVKVARKVAASLECEHETVLRDPHWYLPTLPRAVFETNGSFSWRHGHFSRAYLKLRDRYPIDSALLGDFCEAFSKLFCADTVQNTKWRADEFADEFDAVHSPDYRPLNAQLTSSFLKPDARETALGMLRDRTMRRYEEICDVADDTRILVDYYCRWQAVSCLPPHFMQIDLQAGGAARELMLDPEVHHLLEIMPSRIRNKAGFGAHLIRKLWAPAYNVFYANTRLPLAYPKYMHSLAQQLKPQLGKLRRRVLGSSHRTTTSWSDLHRIYASDAQWRAVFEEYLDASLFPSDVFDHEAIRDAWTMFCAGDLSRWPDLDLLVQLGVASKQLRAL